MSTYRLRSCVGVSIPVETVSVDHENSEVFEFP